MRRKHSNSSTLPVDQAMRSAEASALAAIVRSSRDAVIAKTVDGVITAWNDGARELYGYPAEVMIGRNIQATFPADAVEEEQARHARVAAGHAETGYRCIRVRADGQAVEVVMSMSPVCDDSGQVIGVASISRPVSDRERAEDQLASLLEASPDAIVCVDRAGLIATVNAQVSAVFGYQPAELLGMPVETLLPDEARRRHPGHQRDFRSAPQIRAMGEELELSGRRKDGSTFPIEVSLAPSMASGDVVIAAVRDISQRRATEDALRENEALFRQLAESVEIVFVLRQLSPPAYLYVSPGCRKIMGLAPEELVAHPELAMGLIHPDDRERVAAHYNASTLSGIPVVSEHRIVRPDGTQRWIRSASAPVSNEGRQSNRAVITVEDITDRMRSADALREAEATARAANNAKSEFLSRMSHELRTPLNAVLGFGQLLDLQLAGSEHSPAIGHILKGGRHLLDLINDVLDIARIEAGEMSMSLEPVPVAGLIEETVALMRPLAEAAGVDLVTGTAPDGLFAHADRQRLRQIMLNLLSNAVKYNRAGGRVWITAVAAGPDQLILQVRDNGPGIPVAVRDRVFTAFDRLGAEGSQVEGTGIGLALTRSLAELMAGTVTLDDEPGSGCCFSVRVPRSAPLAELLQEGTIMLPIPRIGLPRHGPGEITATVLYIEDNEPNVRVIEHLMRLRPQWALIHAGLGGLGLELAQAHRPDLILLDLHLPDRSGHEVLQALKADPVTSRIPVAVLSADANTHQSRRLINAGALRYLTKPLNVDEVLALLDEVGADEGAHRG